MFEAAAMVNFNDGQTIGTPAVDIVRILILQARANFLEAWENHNKLLDTGIESNISIVRARLRTLFYELQPGLKRKYGPKEFENIKTSIINGPSNEQIEELLSLFNDYLDNIRLTRLDTKPHFNRKDIEMDNEIHGY